MAPGSQPINLLRMKKLLKKPACSSPGLMVLLSLGLVGCPAERRDSYESLVASVVDVEHSFAQAVAERGIRDGFIAFLAEDAILFRPRAVNAQRWLARQPATPGILAWEPAFADASAAGDLAMTTGPWDYRPDPAQPPVGHGNYLSVWKKQADGSWKAVIDHGTYNPPPDETTVKLETPARPAPDTPWPKRQELTAELQSLLKTDSAFAGASAAQGRMQALTAYVTPSVRIVRNGKQPLTGIEAIRDLAGEDTGTLTWRVVGGDIARSADLGYTYGEYTISDPALEEPLEMGNYVRIWRRQANRSWRVIVDLMSPLSPASEASAE